MSTHNIGFNKDLTKIILELSSKEMGPITFESNHNHYHYIAISSLPLPLHTFWKCNHYHYHYFGNVIITITHYFRLLILQQVLQQQNDILYYNCKLQ